MLVITDATLPDGRPHQRVLIDQGRIQAIGPDLPTPGGAGRLVRSRSASHYQRFATRGAPVRSCASFTRSGRPPSTLPFTL